MTPGTEPRDCPLCESAGSVYVGFCQVCLAHVDGTPARRSAEGPAPSRLPDGDLDRRSDPIRFSEVVDEIRVIALLAARAESRERPVGEACQRAEALLERLRRQFLSDVVLGTHQPASVA